MIDIKFDFDEKEFAKEIMQGIADDVMKRIGEVRCPVHGLAPEVTIAAGSSASEVKFDIKGCCEEVVKATQAKIEE